MDKTQHVDKKHDSNTFFEGGNAHERAKHTLAIMTTGIYKFQTSIW